MASKAVFGLGNPGVRYEATRHNLGVQALEAYRRLKGHTDPPQELDFCRVYRVEGHLLIRPATYMNLSGLAAAEAVGRYNLALSDCLIVCDDVSIPFGRLRLRPQGGDGGHHGLASVIAHLGTKAVPRLRLGIGVEPLPPDLADFVLGEFSKAEREALPAFLARAAACIGCFLTEGLSTAMNRFNG